MGAFSLCVTTHLAMADSELGKRSADEGGELQAESPLKRQAGETGVFCPRAAGAVARPGLHGLAHAASYVLASFPRCA